MEKKNNMGQKQPATVELINALSSLISENGNLCSEVRRRLSALHQYEHAEIDAPKDVDTDADVTLVDAIAHANEVIRCNNALLHNSVELLSASLPEPRKYKDEPGLAQRPQ